MKPNLKRLALAAGPLGALFTWLVLRESGMDAAAVHVITAGTWMLIWWVGEAVPIGVTSVLPMVLFPLFGIASIAETTAPYGSHYVFLFLGGFLIAIALEKWHLHRRFALSILVAAGGRPRRLIGGFMLATAALSMWISNTATTLMMLPIAISVLSKVDVIRHPKFAISLLLGTAYAANLGGIATLVGTPPNVAMAGILEDQFGIEIQFMEWSIMALPFSAIMLSMVYFMLTRVLTPVSNEMLEAGADEIQLELKALGGWSSAEKRVAGVFAMTGLLWVTRRWIEAWFALGLNDTTIAIFAGIALFLIPNGSVKKGSLLEWSDTRKLPWDILLLFGGGLTLANALKNARVLSMVADGIAGMDGLNAAALILLFVSVALMLTEVMSNLALAVVMVPVVAVVALQWGMNPLLLVIPITMASSCAFMLPMATPPNAIIFGSNRVSMKKMASVGFLLNLIAAVLAWIWGIWVLPSWVDFI